MAVSLDLFQRYGLVALVMLGCVSLFVLARWLTVRGTWLEISLWSAPVLAVLAGISIRLTDLSAISTEACLLGIFGYFGAVLWGAIDTIGLLVLLWYRRGGLLACYIVLRALVHGGTASVFVWNALRCTV